MLQTLVASGGPHEVGAAHGSAFADGIKTYTEDRISLSAVGTNLDRAATVGIAESMLDAHAAYDEDLYLEMVSMADAAGIEPSEAVIVGGYTDFIDTLRAVAGGSAFEDTCTAIITPDALSSGAGFLAQTWDMHASATPHVFLFDVETTGVPRALVFTTHGTLGQIGMNTAGIAIGINNLSVTDGAIGVTWPFVVRKALKQTNFDDALACVLDAQLAGGHNFLLFDRNGNGASIEATPTTRHVERLSTTPLVHTNHCTVADTLVVEAERPDTLVESSTNRMRDASLYLTGVEVTTQIIFDLFSDERSICRHPDPEFEYETSGAAIMRPRTGDFWACWGRPSENDFGHFTLEPQHS
ncbi:MAG: C45 family autoproteolytic acyltransferase/hydrolase [Acidimicrobiia bacterium]